MSLECAVEMDALNAGLKNLHKHTPVDTFDPKLYRQPALAVGDLAPERYRNPSSPVETSPTAIPSTNKTERSRYPSTEGVMLSTTNLMHTDISHTSPPILPPGYDEVTTRGLDYSNESLTLLVSVDEEREIGTAMQLIDEVNLEEQIDELLSNNNATNPRESTLSVKASW